MRCVSVCVCVCVCVCVFIFGMGPECVTSGIATDRWVVPLVANI